MTTELKTELEKLKAACREVIELSENESLPPAPWTVDTSTGVMDKQNYPVCYPLGSKEEEIASAAFIATSRTVTPALARIVLDDIEAWEVIEKQEPEKPDHWCSCGQCSNNQSLAEDRLTAIVAQWKEAGHE